MIFEGKEVKVLLARAGSGKLEPNSTVLPTPTGFRKVGDIKVGDFLFDREGKPTKVLGVYPQGKKEIFQLTFGDGRKARCGLEHLWTIVTPEHAPKVMSVKDMLQFSLKMKNRSARYYIPCNIQGVEYTISSNITLDPYVLGVAIGNGCLTQKYFTVSSNDEEVVNRVAQSLSCTSVRNFACYNWTFKNGEGHLLKTKDIIPEELLNKYAYEKHIPRDYLFASRQVRLELLKGLMDSDGSISYYGGRYNCSYSTTSNALKNDFVMLCESLGFVCSVRTDKRVEKYTTKECFQINLNIDNVYKPLLFWLPRKLSLAQKASSIKKHRHYDIVSIVKIEDLGYKEESTCFYVDNAEHLYLTKDFVVTHNTSRLIDIVAEELKTRRPEEIAFVTFTRKGAEEGLRRTCDKFRLSPEELPYFKTLHSLTFSALNLKLNNVFGRIHQRAFNKQYGYKLNRCEVDTGKVFPSKDATYLDFYDLERSGSLTSKQLAESDIDLRYYHQLVHDYEEYKANNCLVDFFDCLIKYVQAGVSLPCKVVIVDECFAPETKVRMADGTIKEIKDIKVDDYVQGTKGATKVIAVHAGTDTMYDVVTSKKKVLFTCNSQHLIQSRLTGSWEKAQEIKNARMTVQSIKGEYKDLPVDPYFFGLWLGNGFSREAVVVCNENDSETINWLKDYGEALGDKVTLRPRTGVMQIEYSVQKKGLALKCNIRKQLESLGFLLSKTNDNPERNYKEKHIPEMFLTSSKEQRLSLLAGLIDSDGMYVKAGNNGKKYRIEMARKELMLNIFDLVSSLGLNPTWYVTHHATNGVKREYYRIDFFGTKDIPTLLPRKQSSQNETVSTFVCRLVKKEAGRYVGITVDSDDHLFLLANGCVVHNCQDITMLQWQVINHAFTKAEKVYIAGDSEQSIYKYSGARPDCLIKLSQVYPTQFLSESYRIPRKVWELSKGIVNMISEKSEMPFNFHEGNIEGSVTKVSNIDRVLNLVENEKLSNSNTTSWYILARNNLYLDNVYNALEQRVIPYWTAKGFFMAGEIISRLSDYEGFRLAGYKNESKKKQFMDKFGITDFSKHFTETNLFTEEKKWIYSAYLEAYGLDKLKEMCKWNPQVLVSTIHHVKGGEADNVALLLDATRKTKANFFNDIDEELRILYVGVTRTKKNLFLVDSTNGEGYDEIINTIIDENKLDI